MRAGVPVVRNTPRGIELSNKHVSLLLSEKAELISCTEKVTLIDIAPHNHRKIASAITKTGIKIQANKAILEGNILSVYIGNEKINLEIIPFEDFFIVEVKSKMPKDFDVLTFFNLKMQYDYEIPDAFLVAGVSMSLNTNPVYYPSGESKEIIGQCTAHTGMRGAKLAMVFCRKTQLRGILKEVYLSIHHQKVLPVSLIGGAFAIDSEVNKYDCLIISEADTSRLPEQIKFYSNLGIKQFDFLKGEKTFIQGDFTFPLYKSAKEFKEKITDPLYKAGIISTLHTYSYYISYESKDILSNPRWQKQLEFREVLTLAKRISSKDRKIDVKGDLTWLKNTDSYWKVHTPYVLIDEEILKYYIDKNGFVSFKRGQCGTTASSHKAGAKMKVIGGQFSHIAPRVGSDLFYEVARRTAKAYNEGGFRGFYFDAFDGLAVHLKHEGLSDYLWYYGASFINEVLRNCEGDPLIEYSALNPTVWSARGRGGAKDTPMRGYKSFIDKHIEANKVLMNRFYVTTLGWFTFYPISNKQIGNYSTKYMFFDDVDYLGTKVIAYDQTMVYNNLKESDINAKPAMRRNLDLYASYNALKNSEYFSEKVKSILREGKYEYKLVNKGGEWAFNEAVYCRRKMRNASKEYLVGENPFKRQKPFIRLECLFSSDSKDGIPLMAFGDTKDRSNLKAKKTFSNPIDLSNHLGLKVSVKGSGHASSDAICIRLRSAAKSGYADYVVHLNFEDWRDIVLTDLDNGENPDLVFDCMEDNLYDMYRRNIDFKNVSSIQIFKSGDCNNVEIKKIEAVPLVSNHLCNPTVKMGSSYVIFKDILHSGEYIEYNVGDKDAVIYDKIGNHRNVSVLMHKEFIVPKGRFSACVVGEPERFYVPSEVVLTIGLYGKLIKN